MVIVLVAAVNLVVIAVNLARFDWSGYIEKPLAVPGAEEPTPIGIAGLMAPLLFAFALSLVWYVAIPAVFAAHAWRGGAGRGGSSSGSA